MKELIKLNRDIISSTGIKLDDGLPFETWEKHVEQAKEINKFSLWILGDLLNYGERNYGEMYSQVLDEFDYTNKTLRNAKWISSKIEMSRRRDNLDFAHQAEVASLDPELQDIWYRGGFAPATNPGQE